ncbi:hypothetical protein Tco_1524491 [Tanacetum coccineum]
MMRDGGRERRGMKMILDESGVLFVVVEKRRGKFRASRGVGESGIVEGTEEEIGEGGAELGWRWEGGIRVANGGERGESKVRGDSMEEEGERDIGGRER